MSTDARIDRCGTVSLVQPLTPEGREWVQANLIVEDWQMMGGGIAVEPRMIPIIVDQMSEAGLTVEE